MIDPEIDNELRPVLNSGEKLLWTDKPKKGVVFRNSDIFLIPFSLLWGGFSVFWETGVVSSGAPLFMILFGIPFVFVGLYITIGRFFIDSQKRATTVYGITGERIIIKSGIFSRSITSLNIRTLSDVTLNQKSDGSGTIVLGAVNPRYSMFQGAAWPGVNQAPMLEMIPDVHTVYNKIMDLQRQK